MARGSFNVLGLKGKGTLKNPYIVKINQGETIVKRVTNVNDLVIKLGEIEKGIFEEKQVDAKVNIINKLSLISLKPTLKTKNFVVEITKVKKVYIKVEVIELCTKPSLHLLSIGNSFSEDALTYLYDIAKSANISDLLIGYLYTGGAPLKKHYYNLKKNSNYERFSLNRNGNWEELPHLKIKEVISKYQWNYISFQQASGYSGLKKTYKPYLKKLVLKVKRIFSYETKFIWQQTWAYSKDSDHGGFKFYQNNQEEMFAKIIKTMNEMILPNPLFEKIIPSGTVIQTLRSKGLEEEFITRDGFHLNLIQGRYAVALMWFKQITGLSLELVKFVPSEITLKQFELIKNVVEDVYNNPYLLMEGGA